jgi:hypothetical protein
VDSNFLDWYFGYLTQQGLAVSYMLDKGKSLILRPFGGANDNAADENLLAEIGRQFQNRVLPGPLLENKLEMIAREVAGVFLSRTKEHLQDVRLKYDLKPSEFDRYLAGITVVVRNTDASRTVPVSLKTLVAGGAITASGIASVDALVLPLIRSQLARLAGGLFPRFAIAAAGRGAAEQVVLGLTRGAAAKGAGAAAGSWTGPVAVAVIVGTIVWEVWDHQRTVDRERPVLRERIAASLKHFEDMLLEADGMIGGIVHSIQIDGLAKLKRAS